MHDAISNRLPALDHVAIAVRNLDAAIAYYVDVLGFAPPRIEEVSDQQVRTAIFGHGRGRLELVCPTDAASGVAKYLDKRGEGLHHICVEVEDLPAALAALEAKGAQLIDRIPRVGAEGARIAFIHPKGAHGVLTELRQGS